jgi:hypothetical protein
MTKVGPTEPITVEVGYAEDQGIPARQVVGHHAKYRCDKCGKIDNRGEQRQ